MTVLTKPLNTLDLERRVHAMEKAGSGLGR
jgi:hypothetical protein